MFFLISNLYTAYENFDHILDLLNLIFFYQTQSFDLSCLFPFSCILYVFLPFSSTLFTSMSASILTMWPGHFILLLTNLPVELFCCITYFLRSFILLSSTLFVRVIRQNQNQLSAAVVVLSTPLSPDRD